MRVAERLQEAKGLTASQLRELRKLSARLDDYKRQDRGMPYDPANRASLKALVRGGYAEVTKELKRTREVRGGLFGQGWSDRETYVERWYRITDRGRAVLRQGD